MASYVGGKERLFKDTSEAPLVIKSRSEGRLKNYPSTIDSRAWCFSIEDRRKHILDLIKAPTEKHTPKLIPVEVIIMILMSFKDGEINELKRKLAECEKGKKPKKKGCGGKTKNKCNKTGKEPIDMDDEEEEESAYSDYSTKTTQSGKAGEDTALRAKLEEKEKECEFYKNAATRAIDQLETVEGIMEERNILKRQLQESIFELELLKNRIEDPCMSEVAQLETEIERLRNANRMSVDEEIQVIEKEATILKKYCNKINSIQEENCRLQMQLSRLEELSGIPSNFEFIEETSNDPDDLKARLVKLKTRFAKFQEIMEERDKLKNRVKQLEIELSKYDVLPEDVEVMQKRSSLLDDVLSERDRMLKKIQDVQKLEQQLVVMKRKADRTTELEIRLANMNVEMGQERRRTAAEIEGLLEENENLRNKYDDADSEARRSKSDIEYAGTEIDRLRQQVKQADVYKLERDQLQLRLDELASGDADTMSENCRCLATLRAERDKYKFEYEEMLAIKCECDILRGQIDNLQQTDEEREEMEDKFQSSEQLIGELHSEIDRLNDQLSKITSDAEQEQSLLEKRIEELNEEIRQKDELIRLSKDQLDGVEKQLTNTIGCVSSNTKQLKANIQTLDGSLADAKSQVEGLDLEKHRLGGLVEGYETNIKGLNREIAEGRRKSAELEENLMSKDERLQKLKTEVESLRSENRRLLDIAQHSFARDQHLDKLLEQSKCAIRRITQALE